MLSSTSHATQLDWTLEGVTFNDGGALSGTFVTDLSGDVLSFDVTSTTGTTLPGFHYSSGSGDVTGSVGWYGGPYSFAIENSASTQYVNLSFQNPLAAGGTDLLNPTTLSALGSYECNNCINSRFVTGGEAIAASVPEPKTYGMMLIGLGVLGFIAYRRKDDSSEMPMAA